PLSDRFDSVSLCTHCSAAPRHLHSFPTRRSSDLSQKVASDPLCKRWRPILPARLTLGTAPLGQAFLHKHSACPAWNISPSHSFHSASDHFPDRVCLSAATSGGRNKFCPSPVAPSPLLL